MVVEPMVEVMVEPPETMVETISDVVIAEEEPEPEPEPEPEADEPEPPPTA
jgi:hypothetical protein